MLVRRILAVDNGNWRGLRAGLQPAHSARTSFYCAGPVGAAKAAAHGYVRSDQPAGEVTGLDCALWRSTVQRMPQKREAPMRLRAAQQRGTEAAARATAAEQ